MNIADAIQLVISVSGQFSDTPGLDAQVLLAHITGQPRSWILAHPEAPLPTGVAAGLSEATTQLKAGAPLPYVLGDWEFYNHYFELTPSVLIPRPETELLVEAALRWLQNRPESRQLADIGTGSGCIAVSLALRVNDLHVTATDISKAALVVAQTNADNHKVADQIDFVRADLLDPFAGPHSQGDPKSFDLITANLPYIPTGELQRLDVFQREPSLALDGGPDGLDLIRDLLETAPQVIRQNGLLLLEIESTQGKIAIELARTHFPSAEISLYPDLGGHDRLLRIQT